MYLDNDRRPTLTPQLAVRVAIIGGIALVAFAVVFFRLWYLQVLSGDKYRAEANNNRIREIKVQAPRGEIVDREGRTLVDNRVGLAVKVTPNRLPKEVAGRRQVYRRLGRALELKPRQIAREVNTQLKAQPFSTATVKTDVSLATVSYVLEHQDDFPGVTVERVFLRQYPHRELGAHLFGTVGEVTQEQLDDQRYRGVDIGDRVGQSGIEYEYDRFLRGRNGASRVQVDALGNLNRELSVEQPEQGRQLRLSIDLDVQRAGQQALAGGTGRGAFVVMNVNDGRDRRARLAPVVRPEHLLQGHPPAGPRPPQRRGERRTALQPRDPGAVSHRLDVQAHHRHGGARGRPDHARHDAVRRRLARGRRRHVQERRRRLTRRARPAAGADRVERRLLLPARPGGERRRQRPADPGLGAAPGPRPQDRHRPARREPRAGADARAGATGSTRRSSPRSPGRRATTSTSRSARATCWPTRCRWRSHTRRSATAAGCSSRGSASGSRTPAAARSRSCRRRPHGGSARRRSSGRRSSTACAVRRAPRAVPRPRSSRASRSRSPARPARRRRGAAPTSPGTSRSPPIPARKYVVAVTDEAGGFGAETAAPMTRQILAELFGVRNDEGGEGGPSD